MSQYIGREIGGYRIIAPIGAGGMAKVFKAYQPSFDRLIALKILPEHYAEDETYVSRFKREAQIIASLEHRHILPVHDYGEDGGITYLAMRYLRGGSLKDLILQSPGGRLPLTDIVRVIDQIGGALDYAHGQGIVHRDIKPANILVDAHGDAFLMDFGIAKVLEGTQQLTATGAALGTPAYMAPEQTTAKHVDHRADIYALGVMLYQMLTGRVPFEADTPYAVLIAHVNDPLPLPSTFNPDIPETLERVLFKALAKNPDDRYQSAGELASGLRNAIYEMGASADDLNADGDFIALSEQLASDMPSDEVTRDVIDFVKRSPRRERRGVSPVIMGVTGLLVIGIIVVFGVVLSRSNASTADAQATAQALSDATLDPEQALQMIAEATGTAESISDLTQTPIRMTQVANQTQVKAEALTAIALTPTILPTITPTAYPTGEPSTITVSGLVEGTQFTAPASGIYRFEIEAGAVRNCPPGGDPNNPYCGTWSTFLAIYLGKSIIWNTDSSTSSNPVEWDFFVGVNTSSESEAEAEAAGQGSYVDIPLFENDYIILVANDCIRCYGDNTGSIALSARIVGPLEVDNVEPEVQFAYQALRYIEYVTPIYDDSFITQGTWDINFTPVIQDGVMTIQSEVRSPDSEDDWQMAALYESLQKVVIGYSFSFLDRGQSNSACNIEIQGSGNGRRHDYNFLFNYEDRVQVIRRTGSDVPNPSDFEQEVVARSSPKIADFSQTTDVRIVLTHPEVAVFVNEELVLAFEDSVFTEDLIYFLQGLGAQGKSLCEFDNFKIWELPE